MHFPGSEHFLNFFYKTICIHFVTQKHFLSCFSFRGDDTVFIMFHLIGSLSYATSLSDLPPLSAEKTVCLYLI